MKHIGKCIMGICILTISMLFYVHLHITSLRYSYAINEKEESLVFLIDTYKNLKFQLASLKSPTALEQKLAAADINLVLPDEIRVVKVPVPYTESVPITAPVADSQLTPLLRLFGFEKVAQAELSK